MSTEVSKPIEVAVVYDLQHPDRLPDLNKKGQAVPIELTSNYWSPDDHDTGQSWQYIQYPQW